MSSALYVGSVMHRRLKPKRHRLRHTVFWMLMDLDEIDVADRKLRLFSRNRFNAVSFFDGDHGEQSAEPLRAQVERYLAAAGIALDNGSIHLFCMPRIFGYGFNPLSIYFCRRANGDLAAVLYEVRNTFGERHSYLLPVQDADPVIRQSCDKAFYVSPFMDMALHYDFRVALADAAISVAITACDQHGPVIVAALTGRRAALTDWTLARLLVGVPLMTIKVTAAILWHALKMWLKGFALKTRPPRPDLPVTIVNSGRRQ
ncbi:DUF1365 domain-containing protein [Rhodoplanes sp. Z2-YC6860]|uniref:DUF1365 domain-containing protein n=1 Tax=Rhodoplanes sp. Z2-YC6860 TaxID=674703 RepID=UPI00078CE040|nr:DUF1365 family protein [Rhodoplanes sp. Z2-YC6860]AMN40825.1 hypothetical protein RHPLAN_23850 [Rhodoplanes sp. Z2-YC6860]